jgi:prepilin-type N-terminal cleavage/methylation domain-containing protein
MIGGLVTVGNSRGFTLIELMIVVGIIGILVAIAAPNFAKYQSKARQSEAKIALSAIYGAEKSFYSEYSAYASSLDAVGYAPEGNKRFYHVGFAGVHTGTIAGYMGALTTPSFASANNPYSCTANTTTLGAALAGNVQNFEANASGCIRNGAAAMDKWSINEDKVLSNYLINL